MRIINKTHWDTEALRKLFSECIIRGARPKYRRSRGLEVTIVYSHKPPIPRWTEAQKEYLTPERKENLERWVEQQKNRKLYSGVAYYSRSIMKLRVPRTEINPEKVAGLFIHEYQHTIGMHHNEIGRYIDKQEWAKDYIIPVSQPIEKPKEDIQLKRYDRVKDILEEKISQLKRLQRQIQKWQQKRRYYERVLVAAGKDKSLTGGNDNGQGA